MKNLLLIVLLFVCVKVVGQEAEEYRRPVILVNTFKNAGRISKSEAETFRNSMIASASKINRVQVIDVTTESSLSQETRRRLREEALSDELARSGEMVQLGANFIMEGTVSDVVVTENQKKDSEGKIKYTYTAKLTYSLRLISTENGTLAYSDSYGTSVTKDTRNEAYSAVFNNGYLTCAFLNEVAPLSGNVIETDYTVKKDKLHCCYITIGGKKGIKRNDYLTVMGVKYVAGEAVPKRIGSLRVIEVFDNIARCKVDTEAKELLKAIKEYLKMKTVAPESAQPLVVKTQCGSDKDPIWSF